MEAGVKFDPIFIFDAANVSEAIGVAPDRRQRLHLCPYVHVLGPRKSIMWVSRSITCNVLIPAESSGV